MLQKTPMATTESNSASPEPKSPATSMPARGITSHRAAIAWSWFLVTVPLTALTVVFLVMVFQYRVNRSDGPFEKLRVPSTKDEGNVVYVDLNSSVILFVTSLASSLAPMLSGFVLILASFPIARHLSQDIQKSRFGALPTPYQLALTLKFLDGSVLGAIWSWILYLCSWRKTRQPQTPLLMAASSVAVLAAIMGLLVSAADIWLHLTTSTVPFTRVSAISDPVQYGFGLVPECLQTNNSIAAQRGTATDDGTFCTITMGNSNFLRNSTMSVQILGNASADATVYTYKDTHGKPYTYLGVPPQNAPADQDFTAHTYGAHTSCSLISQHCHLHTSASAVLYNCSSAFSGDILNLNLLNEFFSDASMQQVPKYPSPGVDNPYYLALASMQNMLEEAVPGGSTNPEFVKSLHGGQAFILGCNMTIYDVEYDRVNGSISRFDTRISNTSVSNIWQTSIAYYDSDWTWPVKQAMGTAVFGATTGQMFADRVALAFSKANLAMGAQGVQTRPALAAQTRHTSLVARVPVVALIAIVVICSLFVLTGVVLTSLAIWAARFEGVPDVQARLGISGLVADRFEEQNMQREVKDVDGLFQEYFGKAQRRVAIEPDDETGWYGYTIREETGSQSGSGLLNQNSH